MSKAQVAEPKTRERAAVTGVETPGLYEVRRHEHKVKLHEAFNRTAFSKFLNRPAGRIFRLAAGTGFLIVGLVFRQNIVGWAAMIWSVFPITAGVFDVCYISAILGGPFSGAKIRARFGSREDSGV